MMNDDAAPGSDAVDLDDDLETESEVASGAFHAVTSDTHVGLRFDKVLALLFPSFSRARLQKLIEVGAVTVNGQALYSGSRKVSAGEDIQIIVPPLTEAIPQAEDILLNVVYEDEDLIVIDKPAGLVVHPGAGNYSGTLVNALLHHCRGSLSGIGGVMRPGIVHRLDKDTTGLMLAAKNDAAHHGLAEQLADRSLSRVYHALVLKIPVPPKGTIDLPLGRHGQDRLRIAVRRAGGKHARTHYHVLERFGDVAALVECRLETGRTHQIRVHMEAIGHPLIGDPLYRPQPTALLGALRRAGADEAVGAALLALPRQMLHAQQISFIHPLSGEALSFTSALPEDMAAAVKLLKLIDK